MIGQITDSYLGHLQVHRRGYVAAVETLPLHLNMSARQARTVEEVAGTIPEIVAIAPRVKFGALFSNFNETTNIRINGIDPARELRVATALPDRFLRGEREGLLERGEILVPELLARGLNVQVGDSVVLIATNRDGSVNGRTLKVRAIIAGVTGPGGCDGYIHIDDARAILRSPEAEVSEFAARAPEGQRPPFEVHPWERLSPFAAIANMIDVMALGIRVLLIAIVLVAVMNVMIMAVYERIREIGTIAAMGTPPGRILGLFLAEGFLLGAVGVAIGIGLAYAAVALLNVFPVTFSFGQQMGLLLRPALPVEEVLLVGGIVLAVAIIAAL